MPILRMILRLFTSIFGTTHPAKEVEDKYALMLFGTLAAIVGAVVLAAWLAVRYVH
jgi:hypothetical protein